MTTVVARQLCGAAEPARSGGDGEGGAAAGKVTIWGGGGGIRGGSGARHRGGIGEQWRRDSCAATSPLILLVLCKLGFLNVLYIHHG
jgi:hypothetical protein